MGENKNIKKALEELEQVSGDEKIQRIAELREKARRDEQAALEYATDNGFKKGLEQGGKQRNIEIAKNMIKENIDKEIILKVTGLSREELENLM